MNGARGLVHQIIYPPGANPQQDLPAVILVKMDIYTGMVYFPLISLLLTFNLGPASPWTDGDVSLIPIVPSIARWESSTGSQCSRKQFPLTVAFGITIHKSQGMTLDHAVLELGPKDFAPGLAFVGISRVRSLKGLAFASPFGQSRLQRSESPALQRLCADTERRSLLTFQLDTYGTDVLEQYVFT